MTWVLTEDGNDSVTSGDFRLPTANVVDAAALIDTAFLKEA